MDVELEIKTASGGLAREYIEVAAGTGLKALSDTAKEMMATSGWKGVRIGVGSNWSVWLKPERGKRTGQPRTVPAAENGTSSRERLPDGGLGIED